MAGTSGAARSEPASSTDDIGYADALRELDGILRELEGDDVDVDRLVERVERAQLLIGLCRDRINHAQMRVRDILGHDGPPDPSLPPDPETAATADDE